MTPGTYFPSLLQPPAPRGARAARRRPRSGGSTRLDPQSRRPRQGARDRRHLEVGTVADLWVDPTYHKALVDRRVMGAFIGGQARTVALLPLCLTYPPARGLGRATRASPPPSESPPIGRCSLLCSSTIRTARSRSSGECMLGPAIGSIHWSGKPARFCRMANLRTNDWCWAASPVVSHIFPPERHNHIHEDP